MVTSCPENRAELNANQNAWNAQIASECCKSKLHSISNFRVCMRDRWPTWLPKQEEKCKGSDWKTPHSMRIVTEYSGKNTPTNIRFREWPIFCGNIFACRCSIHILRCTLAKLYVVTRAAEKTDTDGEWERVPRWGQFLSGNSYEKWSLRYLSHSAILTITWLHIVELHSMLHYIHSIFWRCCCKRTWCKVISSVHISHVYLSSHSMIPFQFKYCARWHESRRSLNGRKIHIEWKKTKTEPVKSGRE